jgi:hypothetical protein
MSISSAPPQLYPAPSPQQIFDASNNDGALVDSLLDGADAGNMTQLAAVVLTVLVAAWLLWRRPGAFAKRHTPLPDSSAEVR